MTEKEKKEWEKEFGSDFMDAIFELGFEEWYDKQEKTLDELPSAEEPDEDDGFDKELESAVMQLSSEHFKENGTFSDGIWETIYGSIDPKHEIPSYGIVLLGNGTTLYAIDPTGHIKTTINPDTLELDFVRALVMMLKDRLKG